MSYNIFKDKRKSLEKIVDPDWLYTWWILYGLATVAGVFVSGFSSASGGFSRRLTEGMTKVGFNWAPQFLVFTAIMAILIIVAKKKQDKWKDKDS